MYFFYTSGSRWHSFRHADLLDEVKSCFGQGEVSSAVIIWRRHQVSILKLKLLFSNAHGSFL